MIQSHFKRHFTKVGIYFCGYIPATNEALVVLCEGMREMRKLLVHEESGDFELFGSRFDWSLTPLLQHEATLTHLTFKGFELEQSQFQIIKQLSHLKTFQYLDVFQTPSTWGANELEWLCLPDNRLKELRDFDTEMEGPATRVDLECLKRLPEEAITVLAPYQGMTIKAARELVHFQYLVALKFEIKHAPNNVRLDLLFQVLPQLIHLTNLTLGEFEFHQGELTALVLLRSNLTSITFEEVQFESPECLSELASLRLIELSFWCCPNVRIEHVRQLSCFTALRTLSLSGMRHGYFTPDELQQLRSLMSVILLLTQLRF